MGRSRGRARGPRRFPRLGLALAGLVLDGLLVACGAAPPKPAEPVDEPVPEVLRCGEEDARVYYGPPVCHDDTECEAREGPGWYCDFLHTRPNACGGETSRPICRPR